MAVTFRLVGGMEWSVVPTHWHVLSDRRAALMLACVALHGAPVSRARLAQLLWRGSGGHSLSQAIYVLKTVVSKELGCEFDVLVGADDLSLAEGVAVDVADDFGVAARRLELGELLPSVGTIRLPASGAQWLEAQRKRWRSVRARAFADAAASWAARARGEQGIAILRQVFERDPGRLDLTAQLAQMLSQVGRPQEGIEVIAHHRAAAEQGNGHVEHAPAAGDPPLGLLERRLAQERDSAGDGAPFPRFESVVAEFPGRDDLLRALQHLWAAGDAFMLTGEAGIGKSYLLERLRERQEGVVLAPAQPGDVDIPYETSRRWLREVDRCHGLDFDSIPVLRSLLTDPGSHPSGPIAQGALLRAQVAALHGAQARGLRGLLVDDLHFADAASRDVLARCIDALPSMAFGMATRPDESTIALEASKPIRASTASGRSLRMVQVPRLSPMQARQFVDRMHWPRHLDDRLFRLQLLSAGLPFLFFDLIQGYLQRSRSGVPLAPSAEQLMRIDHCLPRLSEQQRAVLNLVAVAGPDGNRSLALRALDLTTDQIDSAIEDLASAGLVNGFSLTHDLLRTQVVARLDAASLRGLHALIADSLDDSALPERRAFHCAGAERFAAAAGHALQAARRAELLAARGNQLSWLSKAEDWYQRAGKTQEAFRAGVESILPCQYRLGSQAALDEASRLATLARSAAERAAVDVQRGRICLSRYELDAALMWANAADVTGAAPETRALAGAVVAVVHALQGRFAEGVSILERVMPQLQGDAHGRLRCEILSAYGIALSQDERWQQIASMLPAALEDARRLQDKGYELDVMNALASAYCGLGHVGQAMALQRKLTDLRAAMDDNPESQRVFQLNLAVSLIAVGQYAEALSSLQGLLALAENDGGEGAVYRHAVQDVLSEAWLSLGKPEDAWSLLAGAPPQGHQGRRLSRSLLRARVATEMGATEAPALWQQALEMASDPAVPPLRLARARLVAMGSGLPLEAGLCVPSLALAREREHPVLELHALVRLAQCKCFHGEAGHWPPLARLCELAGSVQSIYLHRPEVLLAVGDVLALHGRAAQSQRWIAEARQWVLRVAQDHVPADCRASFLNRPLHRRLIEGRSTRPARPASPI